MPRRRDRERFKAATNEELLEWRRQLKRQYLPEQPRRAFVLLLEEVISRRKNAAYRRGKRRNLAPND